MKALGHAVGSDFISLDNSVVTSVVRGWVRCLIFNNFIKVKGYILQAFNTTNTLSLEKHVYITYAL
jgi:hypothetical protein